MRMLAYSFYMSDAGTINCEAIGYTRDLKDSTNAAGTINCEAIGYAREFLNSILTVSVTLESEYTVR